MRDLFAAEQERAANEKKASCKPKKVAKKAEVATTDHAVSISFTASGTCDKRGVGTPLLPEYRVPKGPFQTPSFTDICPVAKVLQILKDAEARLKKEDQITIYRMSQYDM